MMFKETAPNPQTPKERVEYEGQMFQVVTWEGRPGKVFEKAVRAPGTRILAEIEENGIKKIILTKEARREAEGVDYRLPGGKVFDSLTDYKTFIQSGQDIVPQALKMAQMEAKQEAGIEASSWNYLGTSKSGASVDWDLHYFLAQDVKLGAQVLEEGEQEDISGVVAITPQELFTFLQAGKIQEGRTAAYLWKWLADNNYIKI